MSSLEHKRHSLAHLLAAAVMELWPDTKRAIGPAIENGFYFDFEFAHPISEEDFPKIEEKMREILPTWTEFSRHELNTKDAKKEYPDNPYKHELIDEFSGKGQTLTFYKSGSYWDLCRGGHAENMAKEIDPQSFKLDKVAGAYWRGNEKNTMLTRIYGVAFDTKKELDAYLEMMEEAKKLDHRKLGRQLDLFCFSDLVGKGLPLFTPRGAVLRNVLQEYSERLREKRGWKKVWTPNITKNELYKISGHWDKFGDELLLVKSQETTDELVMKPMNCPHHQQIYASRPRSYRELPLKFMETTIDYRDEKAGELMGLARVRSITQDDSHTFCTPDQIEAVFQDLIEVTKTFYDRVGMKIRARLSFRNPATPEKYLGEPELWDKAQKIILEIAKKNDLDSFEAPGEAAFYGPKIDFMARDAIGREHQLATPQLDFVQPKRFGLTYVAEDGSEQTPVMIHFALMGSIERFLSVYIEHTAGAFPFWAAPEQVRILPVSEKFLQYAQSVHTNLVEAGIRAEVDESNESLGKKIRNAELYKVPHIVVVGEKEVAENKLTVRFYETKEQREFEAGEYVETHQKLNLV